MKKRIIIIFAVAVAAVLLTFGGCKDNKTENNARTMSADSAYTVREYRGKIAVFEGKSETPDYVLESPLVRDLPMKDREKLSSGIAAANENELDGILQDYDN